MFRVLDLLCTAAPLLAAASGALVSELSGVMAVFADGFINLGAFLCYALSVASGSVFLGVVLSVAACAALAAAASALTKRLNANPFLTGLALNVAASGFTSLLSVQIFGTKGVLAVEGFDFSAAEHNGLVLAVWLAAFLTAGALAFTRSGLYIRTAGAAPEALSAHGIRADFWQTVGWAVAAGFSALAGCVLVAGLSSFVPNISAGCGWTALAAVFLGRKKIAGVALAVLVFTLAEYAANNAQSIPLLADIPSSVLLSLPYAVALLLIALGFPRRKDAP